MVFISKNDKKIWEEYIINFKQFTLNIDIRNKEKKVKILKKDLIQKMIQLILTSFLKKGK